MGLQRDGHDWATEHTHSSYNNFTDFLGLFWGSNKIIHIKSLEKSEFPSEAIIQIYKVGGVGNNIEKENRTGQIHLKRSGEGKKKDQEEEKEVCWLREKVEHRKSQALRE